MKSLLRLCLIAMSALLQPCTGWSAVSVVQGGKLPLDRVEHAERRFGELRFVMGAGQAMSWLEVYSGRNLIAACSPVRMAMDCATARRQAHPKSTG